MLKVLKFGGSSMADAHQFAKVKAIVDSDPSRRVVVVSAAGKRSRDDHKLTDLLYLCYAHLQYGVSCDAVFDMIRSRYLSIRDELHLSTPLEAEFAALREKMDRGISQDELVSRGEYFAARLMAEAAEAAGCPKGAISCLTMPSLDAVQELLHAPQVRLILATGGGAMVRAAYSSGKPAIGVGAGNGPAYIHRSADIPRAVRDILRSKTFDNGTVCASEQSVIVERCCEARVREEFRKQGCYFLNTEEAGRVARLLLRPDGTINPKVVGRTACAVARMAGVTVPESTPVLLANETEAGPARPYSREKLCPILAFFVEEDEDTILRRICEVLAGEGAGHTFVLHAKDEAVVRRFALTVPVSRFLVNVPASLGGIGAETALFPALTLGCGAVGGSSSSNNIGPLDLINLRRVAWGSEKPEPQPETPDQPEPDSALIARLTEEILKKLR